MKDREDQEQESLEENENEHYTQSFHYITEEEAGEPWQEEEEEPKEGEEPQEQEKPKEKPKQTQEEYDQERRKLLVKARAEIALKDSKRKEQERGFKTPIDKSHEWKFYTENDSIWKQNYKTGEKIWWTYDFKYAHQKGKGKEEFAKTGKGRGRPRQPFQPRDAEDAAYWERMDKLEEEKRRKREEAKAAAEEEERQKHERRRRKDRKAGKGQQQ